MEGGEIGEGEWGGRGMEWIVIKGRGKERKGEGDGEIGKERRREGDIERERGREGGREGEREREGGR